ncbi:MAG: GNAT family N-acetyltransferase, partial [Caldilineaceae bacterium]
MSKIEPPAPPENALFTTARLLVRHFQPTDLDDFAALCVDADVMRYMGDGTLLPRAEVARWIDICQQKYAQRGYGTSAVFEQASGRFIGYCGVVRAPDHDFDELVYAYHVDSWGQGYATEAGRAMLDYVFAHSDLDRIYATIVAENAASIHVVQKLGMHFEKQVMDEDGVAVNYYV